MSINTHISSYLHMTMQPVAPHEQKPTRLRFHQCACLVAAPKLHQKDQRRNPDQDKADWATGSSRQDMEQEVDRRILRILANNKRRFEDLDLEPTLSRKRVQARFRRLALVHHPDKGGNPETFRNLKGAADRIIQHLTDLFMRFPGKNLDAM